MGVDIKMKHMKVKVENKEVAKIEGITSNVMTKSRAYDIVNGIGGICATEEEVEEAIKVLKAD